MKFIGKLKQKVGCGCTEKLMESAAVPHEQIVEFPDIVEENGEGQSNQALLALMQTIEVQIHARQEEHPPIEPALVCFVRTYWDTPHIPPNKVDYVDKYRFVGGVCRDVPASVAERWKTKGIGGFIVPNDANEMDMVRAREDDK